MDRGETAAARLVYATRLSDNQRDLAKHYFNTHSPVQHQHLLDELDGRIRSEWWEMTPWMTL